MAGFISVKMQPGQIYPDERQEEEEAGTVCLHYPRAYPVRKYTKRASREKQVNKSANVLNQPICDLCQAII